ncbi:uncharacterized protein EDB93DRAFT_1245848 [Suillus bovinus]|uniref:uncharacterized protein n=1 Tax=Suillus bovinus TaxID=48563 RepID=UPI001B86DFD0|nr:uncharacterized protein EDB93DRAFT_1245848 [Suillus bovinus]KAG2158621.1 hypothetical protein EDB93DRAFT_1245848 [Suillus bovinus]
MAVFIFWAKAHTPGCSPGPAVSQTIALGIWLLARKGSLDTQSRWLGPMQDLSICPIVHWTPISLFRYPVIFIDLGKHEFGNFLGRRVLTVTHDEQDTIYVAHHAPDVARGLFPRGHYISIPTSHGEAFDIAVSHVLLALLSPNTMPKEKGVSNLKQRDLVNKRSHRQDRYELNTSGLSNKSLTLLSNLQNSDAEPTFAMDVDDPSMDPDLEWETVPEMLKDDDTFMHVVWDIVGSQWRVYKDGRTWCQRVTRLQENWAPIIKDLTLAYLAWKYPSESPPNNAVPPPPPPSSPSSYDFDIECIDIYTLSNTTHIQRNASVKTASEALVLNGYIGATPQSPSIAISLRTLELAEAFTKVLCDLYNMPYRRRYQTCLVGAFDIYNIILHQVEHQVSEALGCNSPNWHVLNVCPPCSFELEGEPPLLYRCMIVFDGNNSLSRMAPLGGRKVLQEHLDAWAPTIFLLILLVSALASYPYPDLTLVILVILAFPFALYLSLQQSQYIWPDPFADEAYPCSIPPPD